MCAVAGAMRSRFARSASSMWPGRQFSFSSKKLVVTGFFESVWRVSDEINSVASWVMTTNTSCPCLTSKLASSADLQAAIDPVSPSTTDLAPGRMRTTFRALVLSLLRLAFFSMKDRQLFLNKTPAQITLRAHDVSELLQIFFDRSADDSVAIIAP